MMKIQTALQSQRGVGRLFIVGLLVFSALLATTAGVAGSGNFGGAIQTTAQDSITGEWLIDFNRSKADEVHLTLTRRTERGGNQMSGNSIALAELQGVSREQASGARRDASFRIVREAGTFECEGSFRDGKGVGFWTLVPNRSFVSAMRARGYDNLTENDLFSAALHNVTIKLVEDLKSAEYDRLSFNQLVQARIFKITPEFIREMQSAGYENLTLKELVQARIFKVDSQFAKEVQALGFERQPLKKLVEMRIHKVTPEFIRGIRAAGLENLSIKELVEFRIHKVTPEFLSELKAEGFSQVSPRDAVNLRIHRVDGDFIRRVKAKGFADVTLKQLVDLRIHGIAK